MKKLLFITGLFILFSSFSIFQATAQTINFTEDFSKYEIGASPRCIKTNGAATVAHPTGQQGKWLLLQDNITYKLNRPVSLPKSFTFEFDILAKAEQIKDMSPISFGFVKDNAAREYISNGGAFVQLHYYDADAVNIGNYDLKKEANTKFDLSATANRPLHVKLVVSGNQMAVYLDDTKLADTLLFQSQAGRYFYISGPNQSEHGAKLFISNFKIAGS
ncbi:hypothetical protein [Mucilaginibacter paludis]|uniref:Alginate lyase 2 domain-containing protein n=1 Tax=Mucilaginibacter paludis DSM 18603 TaxID=714943 RepID=H1Y130_9SPHI|nr:hypothetical protein [Mucilaginibacter paludis]EHQ29665.1 hypothetical protein Mucpa_5596 [Mucilaginibacter paludis DSM 18603]